MLALQQGQPLLDAACVSVDNFDLVHSVEHFRAGKLESAREADTACRSPAFEEDGEASSTDVVLAPRGEQVMVEESKKRARPHRNSATPPGGAVRNGSSKAAAATVAQDAFAAFTTKYRDVLGDADAEEAEAVYSMVALTQAKAPDWSKTKQVHAELPVGRPAKRRQIAAAPAGPACSEGGSSDSSAKSAPSPMPGQPGAPPAGVNLYQGMPGFTMNPMQQMAAGNAVADTAAAGNMLASNSMPMAPGFFPGMGMMPMPGMGPPSMGGCPMPPFMPPWAVPPMMFPGIFGSMGMFGSVPPGSPPLMPVPGHGMLPGMPAMPPAFMPGVPVSGCMVASVGGEPAAGFPVSGPVPAAGVVGKTNAAATAPATGVPAAAGRTAVVNKSGIGKSTQQPQKQQKQPAEAAVGSPNSSITAAAAGSDTASKQRSNAATADAKCAAPVVSTIHQELEQLDIATLKPWVVSHFCEDVYLLLLDIWRPDSPKVRDAIWAWKLHVKAPKTAGSQPDYRAFLVSLFGLEKLLQLTAAVKAGTAAGVVPGPAPLMPRAPAAAAAGLKAAGSGDSAVDNVTLVAAHSRMLNGLAPVASGTVVGSATSPHVVGLTVQPQPA